MFSRSGTTLQSRAPRADPGPAGPFTLGDVERARRAPRVRTWSGPRRWPDDDTRWAAGCEPLPYCSCPRQSRPCVRHRCSQSPHESESVSRSQGESCWLARRPPPPIHAEPPAETSPWGILPGSQSTRRSSHTVRGLRRLGDRGAREVHSSLRAGGGAGRCDRGYLAHQKGNPNSATSLVGASKKIKTGDLSTADDVGGCVAAPHHLHAPTAAPVQAVLEVPSHAHRKHAGLGGPQDPSAPGWRSRIFAARITSGREKSGRDSCN